MAEKRNIDFPYKIEAFDPQENQELKDYFLTRQDYFHIGPKKFAVQEQLMTEIANIYNFPLRDNDIFVVTYPKSGTTLTQELVWLICNNLDYEKAQSIALSKRFPFLEISALETPNINFSENQMDVIQKTVNPMTIKEIKEMASPRFIKSHLPLTLLPPQLLDQTKVVYVARDPRDVAVSYYHHHKLMRIISPDKDFKSFWNNFISNKVCFGPYFEHLLEAWEHRNSPNMLFLFYEDLIKDLPEAIQCVAKFFNKTLTDDQVNRLAYHLHIDNFKKNKSVNWEEMRKHGIFSSDGSFIRKGKSGGWRQYFDEEMTAQADKWIARNLCDTDFRDPRFVLMMDEKYNTVLPYEVKSLDSQEKQYIAGYLKDVGVKDNFVRLGQNKYLLPEEYLMEASNIYNLPLRPDDTFIVTFPKSGTTMTQELIWLIGNNLDYEKAASTILTKRFPYLELSTIDAKLKHPFTEEQTNILQESMMTITIKDIEKIPPPRFIKSHLPLSLLPPSLVDKTKVIYVIRDPRDVAVSFYHHLKLMRKITPDYEFKSFWKYFVSDNVSYGPYFGHVLEAWKKRRHPNILVLFYEDMIKDLPTAIRSVAAFFVKALTDNQVMGLANHLEFNNFKKNKSVNYEHLQQCGMMSKNGAFIRKGKSGGWREYFDEEMTAQADEWIARNLRDTDLRFPSY